MKTKNFLWVILILSTGLSFAQVGINTTNPTKELDINGELRIRRLPTQTSNTLIGADRDGNIGKSTVYLPSDIKSTMATANVDVVVGSSSVITTIIDIDLGLSTRVTIPANKEAFVIISYSVPIGISTFKNPTGYYGIRFLRDGIELQEGSRKFSINHSPRTSNMASVSNTYTDHYLPSSFERVIVFSLNGYIERIESEEEDVFRFNMWAPFGDNFNWGKASLTKQVYIK